MIIMHTRPVDDTDPDPTDTVTRRAPRTELFAPVVTRRLPGMIRVAAGLRGERPGVNGQVVAEALTRALDLDPISFISTIGQAA